MPTTNPDKRDAHGWTALMIASRYGTKEQVQNLIDAGANTQVKDQFSMTPLVISNYYNRAVMEVLVAAGAKTSGPNRYDHSPIHHAARYGTAQHVEDAMKGGGVANAVDSKGNRPLHLAARHATPEVITALVEAGGSVSSRNKARDTPLHIAARFGPPENVTALLNHGANPKETSRANEAPLMLAAQNPRSHENILVLAKTKGTLEQTTPAGDTALTFAIKAGLPENTRVLLECGADPDGPSDKITPLMVAIEHLGREKPAELLSITEVLLKAGANPSRQVTRGTPLTYAGKYGTPESIRQLLNAGANSKAEGSSIPGALLNAVHAGYRDNVQALLAGGVNPDGVTNHRFTPLQQAVSMAPQRAGGGRYRGDPANANTMLIMDDLLKAGADPNLPSSDYGPPLTIAGLSEPPEPAQKLLEYGANPNGADHDGQTALMIAARCGNAATLQALLDGGADVNAVCNRGRSALFYATQPESPISLRVLLHAGANTNLVDHGGNTPLTFHAAQLGRGIHGTGHIQLLLELGLDPGAADNDGNTVLHLLAQEQSDGAALRAFLEAGADANAQNNAGDSPLAHALKHGLRGPSFVLNILRQHTSR